VPSSTPHLDWAASFPALLGSEEGGCWHIAPCGQVRATRRRYRGDTPILETAFDIAEGSIRIVDFMPPSGETPAVVRLVEGVRGRVHVHMELRLRFGCGRIRPWLRTPVETRLEDAAVQADFVVSAGELVPFVLTWHPSNESAPVPVDPMRALADTESFWTSAYTGEHVRSA